MADFTPKPEGWGFALMKDTEGNYTVVKLKLKGKQVQSYEVIHPETSRGDAKQQFKAAVTRFCFTYGD